MKRQIRRGCFETNPSSTHAICIAKDGYEKADDIEFHIREFGWEFDTYNDVYSRASYLITAIFSSDKDYYYSDVLMSREDFRKYKEYINQF